MRDVEFLIFDLDGTLIDSRIDIAKALNFTMKEFGHCQFNLEEVECFIGGGVRSLIRKTMGLQSMELEDKVYKVFIGYYSKHLLDNTSLYPSAKDLLSSLKGKKMAVISNKPTDLSIRVLEGLKILSHFSTVLGGDSMSFKKPSPEPLLKAIKDVGTVREKTIMIGDSPIDIEAGKRAGVVTCGVTYGYSSEEELIGAGADIMIDNLIDLKRLI